MTEWHAAGPGAAEQVLSPEPESPPQRSLREAIREDTRTEHEDLERFLDLMRPGFDLQAYGALLVKYHGFYTSWERFLHERAGEGSAFASFYCRDRCKTDLLASDLRALGIDASLQNEAVPRARLASLFPSECHILGALYVIEGSTLGGAVLSKHFMKRLNVTAETGLRFFTGYGQATKDKWMATLQLLGRFDDDAASRSDIITGARSMFLLFRQHLATEPAGAAGNAPACPLPDTH